MNAPSSQQNTDNGKIVAIVSYLWIVGWIIALVLHQGNKTKLGAFHLRQALGLCIVSLIIGIFITIIPFLAILWSILGICLFVFWILGLVSAIQGEEKPLPVIGAKIQSVLGSLLN